MKRLIISLLAIPSLAICAQTDTSVSSDEERHIERYEGRLERRRRIYNALIPDFVRVQYAGSVGLINVGVGWGYGRRGQWETDVMLGYVPRYETDHRKMTLTLRQSYQPWRIPLHGAPFSIQPLSCGLFVNSVLSNAFWAREPSRYPDGGNYYRFSTKIRLHIFVGQRITYHIPRRKRFLARNVSVVWELSTCDMYLISKAVNSSLPLSDILSLSLGLRFGM